MSMFARPSRAVYRVYEEDEYFDGAEADEPGSEPEPLGEGEAAGVFGVGAAPVGIEPGLRQPTVSSSRVESRLRPAALLGVGLILAVAAITAVLIVSSVAHRARRAPVAASPSAAGTVRPGSPTAGSAAPGRRPRPSPRPYPPVSAGHVPKRSSPMLVHFSGGETVPAPAPERAASAPLSTPYEAEVGAAQRAAGEFGFER
ncbi:MAG TPA: hypothetical protein VHS55_03660 [Solirubrobacteraceae bacterium]|jgi:hypothetical protein|nr:hypothetical protein [Solirubrobacteraceae bacterium]